MGPLLPVVSISGGDSTKHRPVDGSRRGDAMVAHSSDHGFGTKVIRNGTSPETAYDEFASGKTTAVTER